MVCGCSNGHMQPSKVCQLAASSINANHHAIIFSCLSVTTFFVLIYVYNYKSLQNVHRFYHAGLPPVNRDSIVSVYRRSIYTSIPCAPGIPLLLSIYSHQFYHTNLFFTWNQIKTKSFICNVCIFYIYKVRFSYEISL